jgi:hypothetical protein
MRSFVLKLLRNATFVHAVSFGVALIAGLVIRHLTAGDDHTVSQAGNTLLTISMITKEALRILENNLAFTKRVNRQYDDKFAIEGAKIGYVVNARKPVRYVVTTGQALSIQDATETQVPVTLTTQDHVDFQFSSADLALSVDDFKNRFLTPAISALANKIDFSGLSLYNQISNAVGTPGTVPNTLLTYLLAGVALDNNAAPQDEERHIVITPKMQAYIVDALKGLFQQASEIARQYIKGTMGISSGFNWAMDQNCPTHTVGPLGGTPTVNGAGQTGASLVTQAWTAAAASRLNQGDVFTIAGVFGVNPQSRQSTGDLQQFVVTAPVSSDGAGAATIPISPAIITSGAYQTVTGSPANAAALTILGAANTASPQGMAFHRDAFTLVTADLPVPKGVDMGSRVSDKQLGVSLRMVRAYDINTDQWPCRIDVLYGWATLRPELACRVAA